MPAFTVTVRPGEDTVYQPINPGTVVTILNGEDTIIFDTQRTGMNSYRLYPYGVARITVPDRLYLRGTRLESTVVVMEP